MQSELKQDPIEQFELWLDAAMQTDMPEPTAMNLASCDKDGILSSRMVLLKSVDEHGFVFYTNYQSRKAMDMQVNDRVALCFWWGALHKQVRVEGRVELVSADESDQYFATRPRGSQMGAIASRQSSVLDSYQQLCDQVKAVEEKYAGTECVPRPDYWGGYRVVPQQIEFWQGRANRLHDRWLYIKVQSHGWKIERLSP